jgi:NAD(P)-dependent dehydrogenase (short-subunit alcohol dehydrogenase family)
MDVSGKIALVTGGSRGIGRAVAESFAKGGARVAVHYNKNKEAAEKTMDSLPGGPHTLVQAEISNAEEVRLMVDKVIDTMGRIDILVNNAGIFEEHPLQDVTYDVWQDHWQRTIGINLIGAANASYCVARHMKEIGGGKIINVTSRGAFRGEPEAPAYGASKAGQNAMSQSLAKALAPFNIFVYAVAPGWVVTDMTSDILETPAGKEIEGQSPMNRVARPEEVAQAVLMLASEGTDFMTGCILDINGASYLRS